MINIGNSLSTPVAGSVDTLEQLDHLIGADCGAGPGYYLEPPMPAEEFRALLEAGTFRGVTEARARTVASGLPSSLIR